MRKKESPAMGLHNFGLSSLLVVFVSLSLLTFGTLALSTAQSDWRLTQELANHQAAYYEAASRAESLAAEISALEEVPDILDGVALNQQGNGASFEIPAGDQQVLKLTLEKQDGSWVFTEYRLYTPAQAEGESPLHLITLD